MKNELEFYLDSKPMKLMAEFIFENHFEELLTLHVGYGWSEPDTITNSDRKGQIELICQMIYSDLITL
jgi:hypothetical protein